MIKVIIYTKNNCPNCNRAKFMFENCPVDVDLEERNIDEREEYKFELTNILNSNTLPTFLLGKGEPLRGFDENLGNLQEVLGL